MFKHLTILTHKLVIQQTNCASMVITQREEEQQRVADDVGDGGGASTHLAEDGEYFNPLPLSASVRWKYRPKLNIEHELKVAVTSLQSCFEKMCSEKQAHCFE